MINISKVTELELVIAKSSQSSKTLTLIDIDDTIITPIFNFSNNIEQLKFIYKTTTDLTLKDEIVLLISQWRLERQVMLTDSEWPIFLKKYITYGLTKMDVGQYGEILSIEHWRDDELKNLNISFTYHYPIDQKLYNEPFIINNSHATFFNGIFFTGMDTKGQVVEHILNSTQYNHIIFVDDKIEQLNDVTTKCLQKHIAITPIKFQMVCNTLNKTSYSKIEEQILAIVKANVDITLAL